MTIWFTSDWHFDHDKDFIYKARGFNNISDMNDAIVKKYNEVVKPEDTTYVLGDLCLGGGADNVLTINQERINLLNGKKRIIIGNHDTDRRIEMYERCLNTEILGYADYMRFNGYYFYISHFPTITSNLDYDKPLKARIINLFGHTHQTDKFYYNNPLMYNVGVDAHCCYPVSIDQIIQDIQEKFVSVPAEEEIQTNLEPFISFLDNTMKLS